MHATPKSHPALAAIAASIGWLCLAPLAPAQADDHPHWLPSLSEPATPRLRFITDPVWNQGQPALLLRTDDYRLSGSLFLTVEDLLGTPRLTLLTQSSASGMTATAGVRTAVLGCGEAAGAWALAATRLAFDAAARQTRTSQDHLIGNDETGFDEFTPSIIAEEAARQNRLLLFAAAHQEWENPYENLLPSAFTKSITITMMSAAYPSPGPAALALIAGGCALSRRRR